MFNIFAKLLNPNKILGLQNAQYSEKLLLTDTVPAGQSKLGKVIISSLGNFFCQFLTGHFETLIFDDPDIIDNGVDYLRGKMSDGSNQRQLFNTYIPLDLFLSPGHVRSALASNNLTTASISNPLFYPQPFMYMFAVNSEILFDVKNDSNKPLTYEIVFHGYRIPVQGQDRVRRELKNR